MSRNARVSAPQRTTIDSSAATTPASATPPRCDLLSRGGSTSSTRTTAAAASTMSTGSSAPTITAGGGTSGLMSACGEPRAGPPHPPTLAAPRETRGAPRSRAGSSEQRHAALALDLGQERRDGGLGLSGEDGGGDADPHDEDEHRHQHRPLARCQVGEPTVLLVGDLAERHPLVHPQQVDGREDDAGGGDGGPGTARLEGADQARVAWAETGE